MIINLAIKSDNKLSLSEAFMLPYGLREQFVQAHNELIEEKNKALT